MITEEKLAFNAQAHPIALKPLAIVRGEPLLDVPDELFIPPEALKVILETFEGPLDLLLYLIKRNNLDILDIPITKITRQYIEYVDLMKTVHFELAAEYLVMAALLAEIKSRMLLPRQPSHSEEEDEEDPRAQLIRRLLEYEQFKQASESLDQLPRRGRDIFLATVQAPSYDLAKPFPEVELDELLAALKTVLARAKIHESHFIEREPLSVRERMSQVLSFLSDDTFMDFTQLFKLEEGRAGVVVSFIAILELTKNGLLELVQDSPFSPIYVRKGKEHAA